MRRLFWAMGCCIGACLLAQPVHAAELRWSAPASCNDPSATTARVQTLLGQPLADVEGVAFEVRITQSADKKWQLVLVTTSTDAPDAEPRTRELSGAGCAELREAAAVAIAMTVSARAQEVQAVHEPAPEPEPVSSPQPSAAEPEPQPTQDAEPEATDTPGPPLELGVDVGLLLDAGALPSLAAGATLEVSLGISALRVIALGALFADQTTLAANGRGGEFGLALAGLLGCGQRPAFGLRALGCVGFEVGQVSARGAGVATTKPQQRPWQALRLELGLEWPWGEGFGLLVRGGASLPLVRDTFVIDGNDQVHKPGRLTGRLLVALEWML